MKKQSSRIREEIARLQDQLKQAETREAERIGRIALKAGLGDIDIEETELLAVFEELAARFRKGGGTAPGERKGRGSGNATASSATVQAGSDAGSGAEA